MRVRYLAGIQFTAEQMGQIAETERFAGIWQVKQHTLPWATVEKLKKTNIITSSGSSTRIEGALLSNNEVEQLIKNGCRITRTSSRSEREVSGYVKTLNFIYQHFKELPVSEHTIKQLHQMMTAEFLTSQIPENQRGAYKNVPNDVIERDERTGAEKVWFTTTPPGPLTETAMAELVESYRLFESQKTQSLVLAGAFIVEFLAVHPFRDGNGRVSRLLTILLLLRMGFDWVQYVAHEKFIEDNKEAYYVALRQTQQSLRQGEPNFNPWFTFFLSIVVRQARFLMEQLDLASAPAELSENEALVYEIVSTSGKCSISFIEKKVDMSRDGLKDLLARLVDRGVLKKTGRTKGVKYAVSGRK